MKKLTILPSLGIVCIIFLFSLFAFSKSIRPTPTASVAADKMNIFYIGIDNPITVAMAGVPSEKVKVTCEDATIENLGNGHYNVLVSKIGNKTIKVTDGNHTQEVIYRVKRIPDPTALIYNSSGGAISLWNFQQQKGLDVTLYNVPFEEKCEILKFEMTHQSINSDPVSTINDGAEFSPKSQEIVDQAQKGDIFYFDSILCNCPGDPGSRKINSIVVKIR